MKTEKLKEYLYLVRCQSIGKAPEVFFVSKTRSGMKKYAKELREEYLFVDVGRVDFSI